MVGCSTHTVQANKPAGKVELVAAPPDGEITAIMQKELLRAETDQRDLLVYVGATWCEPCMRFHHAVESGELDRLFPKLRLVEFNADRDSERLAVAGYSSRLIPLFAVPAPDGRASGKKIEGSVKGNGALSDMAPRLSALIASGK
jgi:hypothetical protein